MLSACVAALACFCLARASSADHALRPHSYGASKELSGILGAIDERLRLLDTISAAQMKQTRRLDVIQDKLDRVENTLSLRLERAQLVTERLEHRLHMLQTSVQNSIKESADKLAKNQLDFMQIAKNLTSHLDSHRHLLEKVSGSYAETWRRGLVTESLMRDGLALVNATRRELADGLRTLAKRQRETRLLSTDLESTFTKRVQDNGHRLDAKMQEILEAQKSFGDSCQRVQQDDPNHVADIMDKLIDSLINKTALTFRELQSIHSTVRSHDNKVMKILSSARSSQTEATCRRLETTLRNASASASSSTPREAELQSLTEKFVALTDRADAALQRLEQRLEQRLPAGADDARADAEPSQADRLMLKLKEIGVTENKESSDEDLNWEDDEEDDNFYSDREDMMEEDKFILDRGAARAPEALPRPTQHRRHLHKHPYDRGPG